MGKAPLQSCFSFGKVIDHPCEIIYLKHGRGTYIGLLGGDPINLAPNKGLLYNLFREECKLKNNLLKLIVMCWFMVYVSSIAVHIAIHFATIL